ncbi:hypothetical protein D9M68_442010 [compost metagenome]
MISHELSTIQAKDAERASIARAMAAFTAGGGKVEVIAVVEYLPVTKSTVARVNQVPAVSERQKARDDALAEKVRGLAGIGMGVSAMQVELRVDTRRLHRIAKAYGIDIPKAPAPDPGKTVDVARQALNDKRQRRREKLSGSIRTMAAKGMSITAMAVEAGCSRDTVLRIIEEHNIQRGPRMDLEA